MHLYWTRRRRRPLARRRHVAASGCSTARGRARSSPPATPRAATTSPCSSRRRRPSASTAAIAFTGHKIFGSLTPVWTCLGLHGMDTSDPAAPKVVHAFMPRTPRATRIKETWDMLGMRATAQRRHDPRRRVRARPVHRPRRARPGSPASTCSSSPSSLGALGFANVYYGLAQRALDLTVASVKTKTSIGVSRARWPTTRRCSTAIAEMGIELEAIGPHLDRLAEDWSNGVDHGMAWPLKIVAAKYARSRAPGRSSTGARPGRAASGSSSAGLERLFRDARLGRIHPANPVLDPRDRRQDERWASTPTSSRAGARDTRRGPKLAPSRASREGIDAFRRTPGDLPPLKPLRRSMLAVRATGVAAIAYAAATRKRAIKPHRSSHTGRTS